MFKSQTFCSEVKKNRQNSIALPSHKWNSILRHLTKESELQIISDQEKAYQEYLKITSRAMSDKWENSAERIREKKEAERLALEKKKEADGELRYKALKENDEKQRQEIVDRSEALMNRLKVGPRQLERAYILSDTIVKRDEQRNFNDELKRKRTEQEQFDAKEFKQQAEQWLNETQKSLANVRKVKDDYKKEIREIVRKQIETTETVVNRQKEYERKEREQEEAEIRQQIDMERKALQRRKEQSRLNALKAMRMAEQRRLRKLEEDELETEIISIIDQEKHEQIKMMKQKDRENRTEVVNARQEIARKLFVDVDAERAKAMEESRLKAAGEYELKQQQIERQKQEHAKKVKAARIQQHIEQMEREKLNRKEQVDERQSEISKRLQNVKIFCEFEQKQMDERSKRAIQSRNRLIEQIKDRREMEKRINDDRNDFTEIHAANALDDKNFFTYAERIIEEANKKKRPILPLLKVVHNYKKENGLLGDEEELPHMESHIDIGVNRPRSTSSIKYNVDELKQMNPRTSDMNIQQRQACMSFQDI